MPKIKIQIFQYHRLLIVDRVDAVSFTANEKGSMTILPDHMPVIASIKQTPIILKLPTTSKQFMVQNGILYFKDNQVNLVADEVKII